MSAAIKPINLAHFDASTAVADLTSGKLTVDDFLRVASCHQFPSETWGDFFPLLGPEVFKQFCSAQHLVTIATAGRHIDAPPALKFKVSPKGAVSVYGLQKFPITLYANQWERIFGEIEDFRKFIQANEHQLNRKGGE